MIIMVYNNGLQNLRLIT